MKHDELQTCEVTLPAELRDYPNIKSPALYLTADVGETFILMRVLEGAWVAGVNATPQSDARLPLSRDVTEHCCIACRKSHARAADYPQRTACSACHESAKKFLPMDANPSREHRRARSALCLILHVQL